MNASSMTRCEFWAALLFEAADAEFDGGEFGRAAERVLPEPCGECDACKAAQDEEVE